MLTRKHDLEELALQSTVTKAEARAERRAALGKSLDGDASDEQHAALDGDGGIVDSGFEEEAVEEADDAGAGARGELDMDAATHGIVKMQARARGMLTRKHDLEELALQSTVTKAEARAERRAALGKSLDGDASHSVSVSDSGQSHNSVSNLQASVKKSSSQSVSFQSSSPDYEDLDPSFRSSHPSSGEVRHSATHSLVSEEGAPAQLKPVELSNSLVNPHSSPGIAAPASFSFSASAAPGDPVSQALLKKLFAIEQSVSLLQAQIVKCLASDDVSVYDQLHNSNVQVEKLMRIRSEILVALQHQQQMAATSPTVTGAASSHFTPRKVNSLSPLGHSSKQKNTAAHVEHGYMSDNASSTTLSASSRTNGDLSSSVSHSILSSSEDM
jgi:hypothetical protein